MCIRDSINPLKFFDTTRTYIKMPLYCPLLWHDNLGSFCCIIRKYKKKKIKAMSCFDDARCLLRLLLSNNDPLDCIKKLNSNISDYIFVGVVKLYDLALSSIFFCNHRVQRRDFKTFSVASLMDGCLKKIRCLEPLKWAFVLKKQFAAIKCPKKVAAS